MPPPADEPVPVELAYRLRPAERVLWWGRPQRIALRPHNDVAMLPVIAIVATATFAIVEVPGPAWHWVVKAIFRFAFACSALSVCATFLTIVVRQRRQQIYAITRERALRIGGFWAGGIGSWPLAQVIDVRAEPGGAPDRGTVWFSVASTPLGHPGSPPVPSEPTKPRFERVRAAADVSAILVASAEQARTSRGPLASL